MIPYIFNATVKSVMDTYGGVLGQATSRALPDAVYCDVTEELNGEFTLEMGYPAEEMDAILTEGHATAGSVGLIDLIIAANINKGQNGYWEPFRIYQVDKSNGRYEIQARHISYDLSWVVVSNPNSSPRVQFNSVSTAISVITGDSSWASTGFSMTIDNMGSFPTGIWYMLFPHSVRELIQGVFIAPEYGAQDIRPRGWNVAFTAHRGSQNALELIDGVNADVSSVKANGEKEIDAVAPYITFEGAQGEDMFFRTNTITYPGSTLQNRHLVVKDFSKEFDDMGLNKTEQDLITLATNWVRANYTPPQISVEVKVYDDITVNAVGDTFSIIAPRMNMTRYTGRLKKLTYDVLQERPLNAYFDTIRMGVGDIIWTR